jgi:hypothetical protein
MVKACVVFESIEASTDDVDRLVVHGDAEMIARARERLSSLPAIRLRVVRFMPPDACALARRFCRAADHVNMACECDGAGRAARSRQRRNGCPAIGCDVVRVGIAIRVAVLLDETAERVDATAEGGNRDVVRTAWQWRADEPAIGRRIVDLVIVAIDAPLAVTADDMHAAGPCSGPVHFTARDRQRCALHPPARCTRRRGSGA